MALAVSGFSSFSINAETIAIPFVEVLIRSAVNFKKRESVRAGITVVVTGVGPVDNDTTIDPNFSTPSETDTKLPFSNFRTSNMK